MFDISYEAALALGMLKSQGYEGYLVGGCVRDSLLCRNFNDYDITTNALPSEIKDVFASYKVIETGIKHGTVTVLVHRVPIEITTYRIDGEYSDNRHPEGVTFSSSLNDDLCRRDFTVNALAYNGELVDLFGGKKDLENKIIRCVGDPDKRFKEDALRILRALRFSAVLGFEIEKETSEAIFRNMNLLQNISRERIYSEMSKLLCGNDAPKIINEYGTVFDSLFTGKGFSKRGEYVGRIENDLCLRLASFFLNDDSFKKDLNSLKADNYTSKRVCAAIENYKNDIEPDRISVKRFLKKNGPNNLKDVCLLKRAEGYNADSVLEIFDDVLSNNDCYTVGQLDIKGNQLETLGFKGRRIGEALNELLDAVICGRVENENNRLIEYIKEYLL